MTADVRKSVTLPPLSQSLRRLFNARLVLFLGPALLYALVFMILPYLNIVQYSVWRADEYVIDRTVTGDNYVTVFTSPLYLSIIANSFLVAAVVAVVSTVLGYALAFYIAFFTGRARPFLYLLVVIPLWTSFLLRAFIWRLILGREGIVNGMLSYLGLTDEPLTFLLFNKFSICIALIYVFIPFVVLPVYASLEKIPRALLEASMDLGGSGLTTFWRVILPLSMPGVFAGAVFAFCLSFGDFIAPTLLGGPNGLMIASVIISQFGAAFNWPLGSALAVIVVVFVALCITAMRSLSRRYHV